MMNAMQFIEAYVPILEDMDQVISEDYYPAIRRMYCKDPHDLITPETRFDSREAAKLFVWNLLKAEVKD